MNKIDEIALRVADKYDPRENYFPYRNDLLLYVKELLAELSNEEKPVAYGWVEDGELKALSFVDIPFKPQYSPAAVKSPLFTHPDPVIASEQEPMAFYDGNKFYANEESAICGCADMPKLKPVFTHPAPIPEGWINPNDKTQKKYLPWIGEECIFTHGGIVYYGSHNGGSFVHGKGFCCKHFSTWDCLWMPLPKPPMAAARSGE